jgi:hypothetical protein
MPSSACIIPDYCILIQTAGEDNCLALEDPQMWPAGQPMNNQSVPLSPNFPFAPGPVGCVCMNNTQQGIIDFETPQMAFDDIYADILQAARDECQSLVPPGWDNNCATAIADATHPFDDGPGNCIGDCAYANPPPFKDCPDDPNPYECNEDGGETNGDDGATEGGLGADGYIDCDGTDCEVDADFAADLYDNPTLLMNESSRLVWNPKVARFVFENVVVDSLPHELGLRAGDRLELVDGLTIDDLDAAFEAYRLAEGKSSITVRIKRGTSWITFTYTFI